MTGVESVVYSSFYGVSAEYQKLKGTPAEFFKQGLLFLAYAAIEKLPLNFQREFAFNMSIASLIGENIYNFGELLSQPIMSSLISTNHEWVYQLVQVFNVGNIAHYRELLARNSEHFEAIPQLQQSIQLLNEKIATLALMELVFNLPSDKRSIHFDLIAKTSFLPLHEVELLVMRALSLKLIKGSIDQVEQTVNVTWVQPRVLAVEQIGVMEQRLKDWGQTLHTHVNLLEGETPELFV